MGSARLFRPPYGKLTLWSWLEARRLGLSVAFWTHDSGDTQARGPRPSAEAIARSVVASGGGVEQVWLKGDSLAAWGAGVDVMSAIHEAGIPLWVVAEQRPRR